MMFSIRKPKRYESKRGFTFIELLVSITIFSVVMLVALGALLSIIDANRKAQTLGSTLNNLDFALDKIFRDIATGKDYYCLTSGSNVEDEGYTLPSGVQNCTDGGVAIALTNDRGYRVQYEFYEGQIWRNLAGAGWIPITAEEVSVQDMLFYIEGTDPTDLLQPQVKILIKASADGPRQTGSAFNIQTTVTQRIIDK